MPPVMVMDQTLRNQYLSYLLSTGVLADAGSFEASVGITVAVRRGSAEMAACSEAILACATTSRPCSPAPVCDRTEHCEEPGKILPFPFGQ